MRRPMLSVPLATIMLITTLAPASAAAPPSVDVTIRSMRYDPVSVVVPQGPSVHWSNITTPSRAHDVVSSLPGYIRSPLMVDGQSYRFTFAAAGTRRVHTSSGRASRTRSAIPGPPTHRP
jgi:plastocyanin